MTIKNDTIEFRIESRLLQELGERLVSTPDVAISELIKNAYDADSPDCEIQYEQDKKILVSDHGHGMTLDHFKTRWMSIATQNKSFEILSPKYQRFLTGAKGVGRFAVRVLGKRLKLTTVSYDNSLRARTKIVARFDWEKLDQTENLLDLRVPYSYEYPVDETIGTTLEITRLSVSLDEKILRNIRTNVLSIASPTGALSPDDAFWEESNNKRKRAGKDPGFDIRIPGIDGEDTGPATAVLDNYVGRAIVKLQDNELVLNVHFKGQDHIHKKWKYHSTIDSPVYADIRYFVQRQGTFQGIGVDGRSAWKWVRDHHGVGVYDKGFRVPPYGLGKDDWLMLDRDNAHKDRDWRSSLSKKYIPIPPEVRSDTARNPMVNMITNYQLVGAVFVHTRHPGNSDGASRDNLIPSMDRQGFIETKAFFQLFEVIRFAIEFLANEDKRIQLKEEEISRQREHKKIRQDLKAAILQIESSPTLTRSDKNRLVTQYEYLYKNVEDIEDYDRRAREGLDMMGFLGVVAGFMTHEHESALWELDEVTKLLDSLSSKDKRLADAAARVRDSIRHISEYVEYTRLFVRNINSPIQTNLQAKPRIRHVTKTFSRFASDRDYKIEIEVASGELMPPIPIPMYEGVILNLFTNALKALVAAPNVKEPSILICAWSDNRYRYISVSDNGIGIPNNAKSRIWDPLFTTTSGENNPLGSGMGLGLPLVRRVIENVNGRIILADASAGYSTCFKARFPRETRYGKN